MANPNSRTLIGLGGTGTGGGGLVLRDPVDEFTGNNLAACRTARDTYFNNSINEASLREFQSNSNLAIVLNPDNSTDNEFETYRPGQSGEDYDNAQWLARTDAVQGNRGAPGSQGPSGDPGEDAILGDLLAAIDNLNLPSNNRHLLAINNGAGEIFQIQNFIRTFLAAVSPSAARTAIGAGTGTSSTDLAGTLLADGTNFNSVITVGVYQLSGENAYTNSPGGIVSGILLVFQSPHDTVGETITWQIVYGINTTPEFGAYFRRIDSESANSDTWQNLLGGSSGTNLGEVLTELNDLEIPDMGRQLIALDGSLQGEIFRIRDFMRTFLSGVSPSASRAALGAGTSNITFNGSVLANNTDLDTVTTLGVWGLSNSNTYTNSPNSDITVGVLLVFQSPHPTEGETLHWQVLYGINSSAVGRAYFRGISSNAVNPYAWQNLLVTGDSGSDFNISELDEITSVQTSDEIAIADDSDSDNHKRVTINVLGQLILNINSLLSELTSIPDDEDSILLYDDSDSSSKRVNLTRFFNAIRGTLSNSLTHQTLDRHDRVFLTDEDALNDELKYITLENIRDWALENTGIALTSTDDLNSIVTPGFRHYDSSVMNRPSDHPGGLVIFDRELNEPAQISITHESNSILLRIRTRTDATNWTDWQQMGGDTTTIENIFDIHEHIDTELDALADDDRFAVSDEGTTGEPNSWIASNNVASYILGKLRSTAQDAGVLSDSDIDSSDRAFITDESDTDDPIKYITFGVIISRILDLSRSVPDVISEISDDDLMLVSDISENVGMRNKRLTMGNMRTYAKDGVSTITQSDYDNLTPESDRVYYIAG